MRIKRVEDGQGRGFYAVSEAIPSRGAEVMLFAFVDEETRLLARAAAIEFGDWAAERERELSGQLRTIRVNQKGSGGVR